MNLRKSRYFKMLCLLVAALFTSQCVSMDRRLISTEEKVIENESEYYIYELEKIKTPSVQDPTVEYKIIKFPTNKMESLNIYKVRIVDRSSGIALGFLVGTISGSLIGVKLSQHCYTEFGNGLLGGFIGAIIGSSAGGSLKNKKNSDLIGDFKVPTGSYMAKKPGSTPIIVRDFPLEFKLGTGSKQIVFKTQTDEQGIVKINLIKDLKMIKVPPDHPLTVYILYMNPESQRIGIFKDSLEPENKPASME